MKRPRKIFLSKHSRIPIAWTEINCRGVRSVHIESLNDKHPNLGPLERVQKWLPKAIAWAKKGES